MSELTDKQIKAVLRREYRNLHDVEIERIATTCRNAKWFKELCKRAPRAVGISQTLNDNVNVEEKGEETEPEDQADNLGKSEAEEPKTACPTTRGSPSWRRPSPS